MAVLSDNDRALVSKLFQEFCGHSTNANERTFGALTKSQLRDAVNAIDVWLNDNAAAANSAIPQPARAELTTKQKARMLVFVIERRYLAET